MTNTNETIADIIAEMRKMYPEAPKCEPSVSGQFVHDEMIWLANRIEAAHKREKAAIEADALAVGGLVEASRATTESSSAVGDTAHRRELSKNTSKNGVDFGQLGNGAKMRKALLFVKQYFDKIDPFNIETYTFAQIEVDYIKAAISAALSAPPRNCDIYKTKKDAEAAFISEECKHPCGNCTVNDEYGCALVHECGVDWLFAPATETKGENDGR